MHDPEKGCPGHQSRGRFSEKIMLKQQAKAKNRSQPKNHFALA